MKKEKNNKNSLRLFQFYLPVTVQKIPVQWNVPLKSWQLVDCSFLFNYMPFSYNFLKFLNNWGRIRIQLDPEPDPELIKVVAVSRSGINHSGFTTLHFGIPMRDISSP